MKTIKSIEKKTITRAIERDSLKEAVVKTIEHRYPGYNSFEFLCIEFWRDDEDYEKPFFYSTLLYKVNDKTFSITRCLWNEILKILEKEGSDEYHKKIVMIIITTLAQYIKEAKLLGVA